LISVPEDRAAALRGALEKEGTIVAALIGRVVAGTPGTITVS